MRHQTTVATIWTPDMEKVMISWDLGDTREGRAADLLAILKVPQLRCKCNCTKISFSKIGPSPYHLFAHIAPIVSFMFSLS